MDDPDEDCEIKEQTTCEYFEDEGGCKGNVRWILEKGLSLGKKVVITGVVMSSAPVVLPQILVVSAVGFAFSVPLGLVYTGYVCTLNLMSKLLPMPTEFPMLEYDQMSDDEAEEVKGRREGIYRIESRDYHIEEEEKEQMDDLRSGVEERIELVKNENEVPQDEDSGGMKRDYELRVASETSGLKEKGYEEDDDELLVGNNESSVEMVARVDMGQDEFVNQEKEREELLPKEDALKPSDRTTFREEGGEWGATELTVEGEGDMGREESIKEEIVGGSWNDGMEREEIDLRIEETVPIKKDSKNEEVKAEVGKKENIGEVGTVVVGESSKNLERVTNEEEDIKRGSVGLLEKIKEEGNADDASKKTKNKKKNKKNKKKKTSKGSAEMALPDVKDQTVISKIFTENQESEPEKRKNLEGSSEVGMEQRPVGEAAGSDYLISLQENTTTSYQLGESEKTSDNVARDSIAIGNVDFVEVSVIASRPEVRDGDNSSEVGSVLPREKDLVDEKKIWEQIDALRTIVGYQATPHRSSVEEVKALYVFAGVELPAAFGNQPDLAELNNKLHFLMSIVGVK